MILVYLFSLAIFISIFAFALRRSEYGVLLLISEIIVVGGSALYPIVLLLDQLEPGIEGSAAVFQRGVPGAEVAAHVFLYAVGAACAYTIMGNFTYAQLGHRLVSFARVCAPTAGIWRAFTIAALVIWTMFFYLVGLDVALANAILARSEIYEGFGDDVRWLFLKTFAQSFLLIATCVVPIALSKERRDWIFLTLFLLLVITSFFNSFSRSQILYSVIAPLLVYAWSIRSPRIILSALCAGFVLGVPVLLYGKSMGFFMHSLIEEGSLIDLEGYQAEGSFIEAYLRNIEFIWYSVHAGIEHFFKNEGPLIAWDPAVAALIGFIPSRVLESVGLADLYHSNLEIRLSCINTEAIGVEACRVPALWLGYSAYVLPYAGGFVFGFVAYAIYGALEGLWRHLSTNSRDCLWIVYFLHILATALMSLIPPNIAQVVFAAWIVLAVFLFRIGTSGLLRLIRKSGSNEDLPDAYKN